MLATLECVLTTSNN